MLTLELLGTENPMALLLENYSKYLKFDDFSCWLSDERSFPFGLVLYVAVVLSDVVSKAYTSTGFNLLIKWWRPFHSIDSL